MVRGSVVRRSIECQFRDLWWGHTEIAEPQPARPSPHVGDALPALSVTSVWKTNEVLLLQLIELPPDRLVYEAFVLHRALVAGGKPANDERDH